MDAADIDEPIAEVLTTENTLHSIWEDDMIEKLTSKEKGKLIWRCKWCNKVFVGWNATKALQHVNKVGKVDIKPCPGRIDKYHQIIYDKLYVKNGKRKRSNNECNKAIDRSLSTHNETTAVELDSTKKGPNKGNSQSAVTNSFAQPLFSSQKKLRPTSNESASLVSQTSTIGDRTDDGLSSGFVQRLIYDGPNPSGDSRLTMAIADMIHGRGLAFTLASHPKFRKVLQLAKVVGSNYKPPNRIAVAGPLLNLNYKAYQKKC